MGKGGTSVLVAGIITLGACASSHRATPAQIPDPVVTTPTTTNRRPAPAFSFDASVPPPVLVNTGTDYAAIAQSLEGYGNWLGAHHPDPALALTTVAPGTQLLDTYVKNIVYRRDHNLRIIEKLNGPTDYTILSATPDAFSARLVENITVHQTIDRSGRVVGERRFVGPTTYLNVYVLAHGRWYLSASDIQQPPVVHL